MEPQLKRKRGDEETTGNAVKMGNNEENRRKEEKVEKQVNNEEEDDLAELDKFVISAMLAGVPFLKAKIKTFAKKKENRLKERVDELGEELALKKKRLNEVETKNENLRQTLKNDQRNTRKINENAKARELHDKIQVESLNELREKLEIDNNNLKKNLESESTFRKRQIKENSKLRGKFKEENNYLQKKLENANVVIEKNLEKIAKLEARNLCLENDKSGQLQLGTRIPKLEQEESEMFKNISQDQSVKVEYQETIGNSRVKSETDMQTQSGSEKQIQSKEVFNMEQWLKQMYAEQKKRWKSEKRKRNRANKRVREGEREGANSSFLLAGGEGVVEEQEVGEGEEQGGADETEVLDEAA